MSNVGAISRKVMGELSTLGNKDHAILWGNAAIKREAFLKGLRDRGVSGKAYSDEVVKFDKENMQVFAPY